MISALLSFFGGSVFRMIWGEISAWLTARQQHGQEMDRLKLQGELDAAAHARQLEAMRLQQQLGAETIRVQAVADADRSAGEAFLEAVKATGRAVGVAWVDAWNALIRPAVATWSVGMVTAHYLQWIKLDDNGWALCGAALGIYLADRALFKRGK